MGGFRAGGSSVGTDGILDIWRLRTTQPDGDQAASGMRRKSRQETTHSSAQRTGEMKLLRSWI